MRRTLSAVAFWRSAANKKVAHATIMDGDRIVAQSHTLLDSSITVGVSMEEVRAGNGAKLYGKYAHTSTFDLKLTDAMFSLEYLAMNTGSDVSLGGDMLYDEKLTADASGDITLSYPARPFFNETSSNVKVYVKKTGSSANYETHNLKASTNNKVALGSAAANAEYCVRYCYNNDKAAVMTVNSSFIPATLSVILEANLYSGGSCDVETSTVAGKIQIKVPRFQLNGSQELSMTSTGVAQTSIEGSALAIGCSGCNEEGIYAEILQVLTNGGEEIAQLIVEDNERTAYPGAVLPLAVYGVPVEGAPMLLKTTANGQSGTGAQYTVAASTDNYWTFANGKITVASTATGQTLVIGVSGVASTPTAGKSASLKVVVS